LNIFYKSVRWFFEKIISSPGNLEDLAPTASKLIEEQAVRHPMIQELVKKVDGLLKKKVPFSEAKKFLKQTKEFFACDHDWRFCRNIYGEEINSHGGNRSLWKCCHCGRTGYNGGRLMPQIFVFDVESNWLHGEGFAVGAVVRANGKITAEFCGRVELGEHNSWVEKNVLPNIQDLPVYNSLGELRRAFWKFLQDNKSCKIFADVGWPVGANFLSACIAQEEESGPYPLHDVATLLLSRGIDPDTSREELCEELPKSGAKHSPLWDAEVSSEVVERYYFSNG